MTNTYPYAPLKPREIPAKMLRTTFEYGMQAYSEAGSRKASQKLADLAEQSFQLEKRLLADIAAVTR